MVGILRSETFPSSLVQPKLWFNSSSLAREAIVLYLCESLEFGVQ